MENRYRIIVHCYVIPKNVTFLASLSTFSFPCRSIHHGTVVSAFLFDIARHRSSDGTKKRKKKNDSRGASFTFEAATAISTIHVPVYFFRRLYLRAEMYTSKNNFPNCRGTSTDRCATF